jgi:hypothetical protein
LSASPRNQALASLRLQVNWSSFTPAPESPGWLQRLAHLAGNEAASLALVGRGGLSVKCSDGATRRLQVDPAALFLAGLIGRSRTTRAHVAIGLPPAGENLPLLFAASAVLANTVDRVHKAVMVVSRDLGLRVVYPDLRVGTVDLQEQHPGGRLDRLGRVIPLKAGQRGSPQGVCFFLPWGTLPNRLATSPCLAILDLRYGSLDSEKVLEWQTGTLSDAGIAALYTLGDSETRNLLMRANFLDLPLDEVAMDGCSPLGQPRALVSGVSQSWSLAGVDWLWQRQHTIVPVPGAQVEEAFTRLNSVLDQFHEEDTSDIRRARWAFAVLKSLPVTLDYYEEAAAISGRWNLWRSIERVGSLDRFSRDSMAMVNQTLRLLLQQAYSLLRSSNPRAPILQRTLLRSLPDIPRLVVARDPVSAVAIRKWLAFTPDLAELGSQLEVVTPADLGKRVSTDQGLALLCGPVARRHEWILRAPLGREVTWLAYDFEVDHIYRQLNGLFSPEAAAIAARSREATMAELVPYFTPKDARADPAPPTPLIEPPFRPAAERPPKPVLHRGGLAGLGGALAAAEKARAEAEATAVLAEKAGQPEEGQVDSEPDEMAEAGGVGTVGFRVRYSDGRTGEVTFKERQLLDVVPRTGREELLSVSAADIRVGDLLLLTNTGHHASIFQRIADLADSQPETAHLSRYRAAWGDVVSVVANRFTTDGADQPDYEALLLVLKPLGATITSAAAVRSWLRGQVIGPETLESIRAMGRLAGNHTVESEAEGFNRAFRTIRGIHQGIGRRLATEMRRAPHDRRDTGRDALSDRFGIAIDEVLAAVEVATVEEVRPANA